MFDRDREAARTSVQACDREVRSCWFSGAVSMTGVLCSPGVELSFVADDGERRGLLSELWGERFEQVAPVRPVRSLRGRRNFAGQWWLACTGSHVGFESWLERDHVMLLDFDPDVLAVASRPFQLWWTSAGRSRRHVPDYFARLRDGTGVVIDVRAGDGSGQAAVEATAVMVRACSSVGWEYRNLGAIDTVWAANVRWLAGYRHRRCYAADRACSLRQVLQAPLPLADAVRAVGDPIAVLPVVFHLIWTGVLVTDLRSAPLAGNAVISLSGGQL